MNLEMAMFLQFKPKEVFGKETFMVTPVRRNKRWFEVYRPLIEEFLETLRYYLKNPEALEMLKAEFDIKRTLFNSMPLYKGLWSESLVSNHELDLDVDTDSGPAQKEVVLWTESLVSDHELDLDLPPAAI
jgi:hypothetical protein